MQLATVYPVFLAVMAGAVVPGPALAQATDFPLAARPRAFMAIAQRDLAFGEVLAGIPETVRPDDSRQAGLFEIHGIPEGTVRLEFLLPDALVSPLGARLPLAFGPGDGYADFSYGRPPRGLRFDPRVPLVAVLGPNGRLIVRLGGTVAPSRTQADGEYHATIALTVFDLGS
jgi:hypothetical protein